MCFFFFFFFSSAFYRRWGHFISLKHHYFRPEEMVLIGCTSSVWNASWENYCSLALALSAWRQGLGKGWFQSVGSNTVWVVEERLMKPGPGWDGWLHVSTMQPRSNRPGKLNSDHRLRPRRSVHQATPWRCADVFPVWTHPLTACSNCRLMELA